jgi:uncharacterized membrane protein
VSVQHPYVSVSNIAAQLRECKLKNPLSFYAMQEPTASGPVLGFAAIAPAEIKSAARKLAQVLEPICVEQNAALSAALILGLV